MNIEEKLNIYKNNRRILFFFSNFKNFFFKILFQLFYGDFLFGPRLFKFQFKKKNYVFFSFRCDQTSVASTCSARTNFYLFLSLLILFKFFFVVCILQTNYFSPFLHSLSFHRIHEPIFMRILDFARRILWFKTEMENCRRIFKFSE